MYTFDNKHVTITHLNTMATLHSTQLGSLASNLRMPTAIPTVIIIT